MGFFKKILAVNPSGFQLTVCSLILLTASHSVHNNEVTAEVFDVSPLDPRIEFCCFWIATFKPRTPWLSTADLTFKLIVVWFSFFIKSWLVDIYFFREQCYYQMTDIHSNSSHELAKVNPTHPPSSHIQGQKAVINKQRTKLAEGKPSIYFWERQAECHSSMPRQEKNVRGSACFYFPLSLQLTGL